MQEAFACVGKTPHLGKSTETGLLLERMADVEGLCVQRSVFVLAV